MGPSWLPPASHSPPILKAHGDIYGERNEKISVVS